MIKIDKDIPLPLPGKTVYPFEEMTKGDSFFVKGDSKTRSTLTSSAAYWASKKGNGKTKPKFTIKKQGDGYRVWRIA